MFKKLCFMFLAVVLTSCLVFADDEPIPYGWSIRGMITGTYAQTAPSSNWTGQETFSMTWQAKLFAELLYNSPTAHWVTRLREEYGQNRNNAGSLVNLDFIELDSVYTFRRFAVLNPFVSFNLTTQNYQFFNPATYTGAAGLSVTIVDNEVNTLTTRAGIAYRHVSDSVTLSDGVLVGNSDTLGAEWVTNYSLNISNVGKYISEFRLFETFDNAQNLSWDNALLMQMTSILVMQISYRAFFDNTRITRHLWPSDIETLFSVSIGASFNMF